MVPGMHQETLQQDILYRYIVFDIDDLLYIYIYVYIYIQVFIYIQVYTDKIKV